MFNKGTMSFSRQMRNKVPQETLRCGPHRKKKTSFEQWLFQVPPFGLKQTNQEPNGRVDREILLIFGSFALAQN